MQAMKSLLSRNAQKNTATRAMRLYCAPYAGGGSSIYRRWVEEPLFQNIEICPIRLPGREERIDEPPYTDLMKLVRDVCDEITTDVAKPYVLFGHSLGGLIAFEIARELQTRGYEAPQSLIVSAYRAPDLVHPYREAYRLDDAKLVDLLRSLNGTPCAILENQELMELVLPCMRADFEMLGTYEYKEKTLLRCPIFAYGGDADESVSFAQVDGWKHQTTASYKMTRFQGDHFYLWTNAEQFLPVFANDVMEGMIF